MKGAHEAVRPLSERLDLDARMAPFAAQRWIGPTTTDLPALMLDDVSDIPFLVNISGVEEYQHRARLRARSGDLFAAATPMTDGYEDYCRESLLLGGPEFLRPEPIGGPMQVARSCSEGAVFARLVDRAKEAGGLAIHPYMGIESVWTLAKRIADASGTRVSVLGPPAPVTWIANDKSLFSETVSRVLDADWVVETARHTDPAGLAASLLDFGTRHARVGLKRTRCASGMGNAHWDLKAEGVTDIAAAESRVRAFLEKTLWDGEEEVLVVAWEQTSLSPSTQMWIPPLGVGPPRLDGIYEQILEREEGVFVGSRPSALPTAINLELAKASMLVSAAFQKLGYVGRCSFDTLVLGDPSGDFRCKFIECNGRWGGTSTPMHLLDQLVEGPRPPYRAQDFIREDLAGVAFTDLLAQVKDALYDPRTGQGQFVFYNVGPLVAGKIDVISIGATQQEAEEAVLERLPRLLGVR